MHYLINSLQPSFELVLNIYLYDSEVSLVFQRLRKSSNQVPVSGIPENIVHVCQPWSLNAVVLSTFLSAPITERRTAYQDQYPSFTILRRTLGCVYSVLHPTFYHWESEVKSESSFLKDKEIFHSSFIRYQLGWHSDELSCPKHTSKGLIMEASKPWLT